MIDQVYASICKQVELAASRGCEEVSLPVSDVRYLLQSAGCALVPKPVGETWKELRHANRSANAHKVVEAYLLKRDGTLPMTSDELKEEVFQAYKTTDNVYALAKHLECAGLKPDGTLVCLLQQLFDRYPELAA